MKKRLLILDDEQSVLFALSDYFTTHGYQVDCACEIEEAKALLAAAHYFAAIIDLNLGGSESTEGLEMVRWARQRFPSTRLIILTAYGTREIEMEARQCGVDALLHKPKSLLEVERVLSDKKPAKNQLEDAPMSASKLTLF